MCIEYTHTCDCGLICRHYFDYCRSHAASHCSNYKFYDERSGSAICNKCSDFLKASLHDASPDDPETLHRDLVREVDLAIRTMFARERIGEKKEKEEEKLLLRLEEYRDALEANYRARDVSIEDGESSEEERKRVEGVLRGLGFTEEIRANDSEEEKRERIGSVLRGLGF